MFTKNQYEEYEMKYKNRINALTQEFIADVGNAMELFHKKNQKENGNVVIAASHKALRSLFEGSCCELVKASENKERAIRSLSNQIDSIKNQVENVNKNNQKEN